MVKYFQSYKRTINIQLVDSLLKKRNMNTHEAETVAEYMIDTFYLDFIQEDYELFLNKFKNFDAKSNVAISTDDLSKAETFALRLWNERIVNQKVFPILKSRLNNTEEKYLNSFINSQKKALEIILQNNKIDEWSDTCLKLYDIYKEFQETKELANVYKVMATSRPLIENEFIKSRSESELTTAKSIARTIYISKVTYEPIKEAMFNLKPNIAKLQTQGDIKGLIKALEHKNQDVQVTARKSIIDLIPSIINNESAVEQLISAVGHKSPLVYKTISEIFFDFFDFFSPFLLLALINTSSEVKWRCTEIIGRHKFVKALDALSYNLLNDENENVKEASKWAIESIGGEEALKYLEEYRKKEAHKINMSLKGIAVTKRPTDPATMNINKKTKRKNNKLKGYKYYDARSKEEKNREKKAHNTLDIKNEQIAQRVLFLQRQKDTPENYLELKKIGNYLCSNGGSDRMALIAYRVEYLGGSSRQCELDWNGICGWLL